MSERDLEMKAFGPFEIKSEDRGEVEAVVATLGVVDKDGDVILPGAFPAGGSKVKLSGYGHDVITEGAPPVGKGVVVEDNGRAIFKGQFFMSTQRGREAFHTTKELGAEGEWSFGFPKAVKTADLTDDWKTKGARRVIAGLTPIEASPVFVGAGWGTGTLSTKAADEPLDPQTALNALAADLANVLADPDAAEAQMAAEAAALAVDTPADEMQRHADERIAAEAAEAKATAEVAAQLKAAQMAELREALLSQRRLAHAMSDNESVQRVQRALKRVGEI